MWIVFSQSDVSGNPMTPVQIIKRKVMTRTFTDNETNGLTARPDSQRNEVLFFGLPHFLFFNFLAAAQVAHFVLPLLHKPTRRQNKKSHFIQRIYHYLQHLIVSLNYAKFQI